MKLFLTYLLLISSLFAVDNKIDYFNFDNNLTLSVGDKFDNIDKYKKIFSLKKNIKNYKLYSYKSKKSYNGFFKTGSILFFKKSNLIKGIELNSFSSKSKIKNFLEDNRNKKYFIERFYSDTDNYSLSVYNGIDYDLIYFNINTKLEEEPILKKEVTKQELKKLLKDIPSENIYTRISIMKEDKRQVETINETCFSSNKKIKGCILRRIAFIKE